MQRSLPQSARIFRGSDFCILYQEFHLPIISNCTIPEEAGTDGAALTELTLMIPQGFAQRGPLASLLLKEAARATARVGTPPA